jgi:hypothetical protein
MEPSDFQDKPIKLVPEEYFSGKTKGVGVFYNRFGDLKTSFIVTLNGYSKSPTEFILEEQLIYENGEKLNRVYKIEKINPNLYHAYTEDIDGVGIIEVYGNTMKWTYDLNQEVKKSKILLHFNDWMHLQQDGIILNRAYASKFGLNVGEVFMSIRKLSE